MWRKVFKKNESVVSRRIAEEMFLVPIRGELADMKRIFSLNPVAEYIWQELDGERNLEDIRKGVLDAFDVNKREADDDISQFIDELLTADLITEVT
jgi:hypothetical protein